MAKMQSETSINGTGKLRQFVCIEYPGYVKDVDNAIKTLGGIDKISEVFCEDNRRMELRLRPDDVFCKPTCGEKHSSTALLVKVIRRRKKKKKGAAEDVNKDDQDTTTTTQLQGVVHTTYRFNSLCDFQYLPVINTDEDTKIKTIHDLLVPKGMAASSWLHDPSYLFLPPAAFSRMDTPQDYRYRREATFESKKKVPQNIICRTRQRRTHFAIFHSFKDEDVPQKPLSGAISQIRYKFMDTNFCNKLKAEFEKRPIWSKNALKARLGYTSDNLKYLLPTLSYYFQTGPWRNLWVRFGYDPRIDPNSWFYQTFDFRIRQAGGVKTKVEAKRSYSNYILPYKSANTSKKKTSVIQSLHFEDNGGADGGENSADAAKNTTVNEELYIFRPGMIPPYRQMFYQYCDIHVPEIQKLLEECILSGANPACTEKYGWLPAGVEIKCRDIVSRLVESRIAERTAEGKDLEMCSDEYDTETSPVEGNSTEEDPTE